MATENSSNNSFDLRPRISVIGIGGAGGNAVNNMVRAKLEGVDFIVANTDAQALSQSLTPIEKRLQLGLHITQGLGAGSKPDVGRASAEESMEEVLAHIKGANMLFITAGMGGGTGTGAAPVIARIAKDHGILTIGVVTKPFQFEGANRMRSAEHGIEELQQYVDTLIIIPNQNLFRLANERTTFADAFKMADDVLYSGVRGITDLMIMPGLINLDFADVRAIMAEMGKAMMGTGEAEGERRALDAAEAAISNPLLDDVSMKGARGVLISVTGGYDMTLYEVDEAANRIREDVEAEANIIFGSTFDERLNGKIRVSVVATGIGNGYTMSSSSYSSGISNHDMPPKFNNFPSFAGLSKIAKDHNLKMDNTVNEEPFSRELPEEEHKDNQLLDLNSPAVEIENNKNSQQNLQATADKATKKRSSSLFERFTGVSKNKSSQSKDFTDGISKNSEIAKENNDLLDIPAFLRRSSNN